MRISAAGGIDVDGDLRRRLAQMEALLSAREADAAGRADLGSSSSSCDRLMREAVAVQAEAREAAEGCSTLAASLGAEADTETSARYPIPPLLVLFICTSVFLYLVLTVFFIHCFCRVFDLVDRASRLCALLELRTGLLARAAAFFREAQAAGYRMDQLETTVKRGGGGRGGGGLAADLEEAVGSAISMGNSLLDEAEAGAAGGIAAVMDHLRNRVGSIRALADLQESR